MLPAPLAPWTSIRLTDEGRDFGGQEAGKVCVCSGFTRYPHKKASRAGHR